MTRLTHRMASAIAGALGNYTAGSAADIGFSGPDTAKGERRLEAAEDAKPWVHEAERALRHGGVVLVLSKAELNELRTAAGNSASDPDWFRDFVHNRRAFRSLAEKVGFHFSVYGPEGRPEPLR